MPIFDGAIFGPFFHHEDNEKDSRYDDSPIAEYPELLRGRQEGKLPQGLKVQRGLITPSASRSGGPHKVNQQ